jgi:predicted esterase
LPDGVTPGVVVLVAVPGDRAAHVVHGVAGTRRAIVYLHGLCGNIHAIDGWAKEVSEWGTLIAVQGDRRCPGGSRRKWGPDIGLIDIRIDRALRAVESARGGQLDRDRVALIGYSQGATRAEALVKRFGEKYPWVVAAGTPVEPRVDRLGRASRIAIVGGAKEPRAHMRRGVEALSGAGKQVRFFLLPDATHGVFGPDGPRVINEVFRFLFAEDTPG